MTNQELWMKIVEAQSRKLSEIVANDSDGKQVSIKVQPNGWYEGFY